MYDADDEKLGQSIFDCDFDYHEPFFENIFCIVLIENECRMQTW